MGKKALIVNDVRVAREVLAAQLRDLGFDEPLVAGDGAQALQILEQFAADVVVSDVHMPVLDGFQLCRLMRSQDFPALNRVPVVLTSATFRDAAAQRLAGDVGAQAFLQWPFSRDELRRSVGRALEAPEARAGGKERVLIAEDEDAVRDDLSRALTQAGFTVRAVPDGAAAIAAADNFRPHIVLCDYKMPRAGGDVVLAHFREHAPDVPVVIMTGHGNERLAAELLRAGAYDYIPKPFELRQIPPLCRGALEKHAVKGISRQFGEMIDALSRSEARYRALFERAGEALFLCDGQGRVREANVLGCELTQQDTLALAGRPLGALFQAVDPELGDDIVRALRHMRGASLEAVLIVPGREGRPIELSSAPLDVGGDEHFLAVARDLTDRKWIGAFVRHEHQFLKHLHQSTRLIDSEEGFAAFVEGALRSAMSVLEMDAGVLASSPWGGERFELDGAGHRLCLQGDVNDALARRVLASCVGELPEDAGEEAGVRMTVAPALSDEERAQGYRVRVVAVLSSQHGHHGLLVLWRRAPVALMHRDVSLVRSMASHVALALENARLFARVARAQDDWQRTFDAVGDSILVIDQGGRIARANLAACQRIGAPAAELLGRPALEVLYGDEPDAGAALVGPNLRSGPNRHGAHQVTEGSVPGLGGGTFSVTVSPLYRQGTAHSRGVAVVARDVTAERRAQQQLVVAEKMSTIGRMAAGVTHEINNPAAFVMLNVAHLQERLQAIGTLLGDYRAAIRKAGGEAALAELREREGALGLDDLVGELSSVTAESIEGMQRIRDITQELRLFSRVRDQSHQPFDLNVAVDSALAISRHQVRHRARLVRETATVPVCDGDVARLTQVFVNLLVNAAQAIPEGHADAHQITVRTGVLDGAAYAEIEDTGSGIAPENLARVFEPFFTTKDPGQGTGLGLALSMEIVKRHGGDIEVASELGRGTRFRVTLPVSAHPSAPDGAQLGAPKPSPSSRARILFIEDETSLHRAVQRVLHEHQLVFAVSGREALAILERDEAFDLILCDIVMPDVSGLEVFDWLRESKPQLLPRLAFMTGGVRTDEALLALRESGRPIIEKPVEASALRRLVTTFRP